jgi:hypothetical protein
MPSIDHAIGRGVDDVDVVAGAVGLNDSRLEPGRLRGARQGLAPNPGSHPLPFGVVLRLPVLAAVVVRIAAGALGERMAQQPARVGITRDDVRPH